MHTSLPARFECGFELLHFSHLLCKHSLREGGSFSLSKYIVNRCRFTVVYYLLLHPPPHVCSLNVNRTHSSSVTLAHNKDAPPPPPHTPSLLLLDDDSVSVDAVNDVVRDDNFLMCAICTFAKGVAGWRTLAARGTLSVHDIRAGYYLEFGVKSMELYTWLCLAALPTFRSLHFRFVCIFCYFRVAFDGQSVSVLAR